MKFVIVVAALLAIVGGATRSVGSGDQARGDAPPAIAEPAQTVQAPPTGGEAPADFSIRPLDDPR